jgi:three-Cys-motif partner protein
MSSEKGTTWHAAPHTIAKIEMVRKYFVVWLSIFGATFKGVDLWYIDGFAGPGEYTNHPEGSPVAALRAAEEALAKPGWQGGDVHCLFIEEDPDRFANLVSKLSTIPEHPRIKRHLFDGTFEAGIADLREQVINPFSPSRPTFAFIDPFGIKGLPLSVVKTMLESPMKEVLVNLDSDGVGRVYAAGESANHRALLNDLFGDTAWEDELRGVSAAGRASAVLSMYKRRLATKYAFAFEMQKAEGQLDYHLVFATKHPRVLERMKEVMGSFSDSGEYIFSDDKNPNQPVLFRFKEPSMHAPQMAKYFRGQTVGWDEVRDYALNESPFPNPKSMLKVLEDGGQLSISYPSTQKRRAGTYPEWAHGSIRFKFPA